MQYWRMEPCFRRFGRSKRNAARTSVRAAFFYLALPAARSGTGIDVQRQVLEQARSQVARRRSRPSRRCRCRGRAAGRAVRSRLAAAIPRAAFGTARWPPRRRRRTGFGSRLLQGQLGFADQAIDHGFLEAGGDVGDFLSGEGIAAAVPCRPGSSLPGPATRYRTAVFRPLKLKSSRVGSSSSGRGKRYWRRVAVASGPLDRRARRDTAGRAGWRLCRTLRRPHRRSCRPAA